MKPMVRSGRYVFERNFQLTDNELNVLKEWPFSSFGNPLNSFKEIYSFLSDSGKISITNENFDRDDGQYFKVLVDEKPFGYAIFKYELE